MPVWAQREGKRKGRVLPKIGPRCIFTAVSTGPHCLCASPDAFLGGTHSAQVLEALGRKIRSQEESQKGLLWATGWFLILDWACMVGDLLRKTSYVDCSVLAKNCLISVKKKKWVHFQLKF